MEEQVIIETTATETEERTTYVEPTSSDSTAIVLDTQTADDKDGLDFKSTLVGGVVVAAVGGIALGVKALVNKVKKAQKDKAEYEAWKESQKKAEEEAKPEQQEEPKTEQEQKKEEPKEEPKKK